MMHAMHMKALRNVDLNLLLVLQALLQERHVTRAASRLGLSQSATSHALARLRELYADPLLVQTGRKLALSPRATRLLPALERGLGELGAAVTDEPAFEPRTARQRFNVGASDYAQVVLLPQLLARLAREAPGVEVTVNGDPHLTALLETGEIDVAITPGGFSRSIASRTLFSDDFLCIVRRRGALARGAWTLARYLAARHVVVAPTGTPGSIVDTVLAQRGLARQVALRVPNFLVAPIVVARSDFVSTAPARLARDLAGVYALTILPPPLPLPSFELKLAWHPRLEHDPAQRWFRQVIAELGTGVGTES
jgi:LysR family transcriptional regulator, transcriptional activator of nodD3 and syrA